MARLREALLGCALALPAAAQEQRALPSNGPELAAWLRTAAWIDATSWQRSPTGQLEFAVRTAVQAGAPPAFEPLMGPDLGQQLRDAWLINLALLVCHGPDDLLAMTDPHLRLTALRVGRTPVEAAADPPATPHCGRPAAPRREHRMGPTFARRADRPRRRIGRAHGSRHGHAGSTRQTGTRRAARGHR